MPGGVFLVVFPQASGLAVVQAFFSGFSRNPQAMQGKECDAVAEISNMVVNPVVNALGDTCGMLIFLSAPLLMEGGREALVDLAFEKLVVREDRTVLRTDISLDSPESGSRCEIVALFNSAFTGHLLPALRS
jgi:hypothetical protein